MNMSHRHSRRFALKHAPADDLARAIGDIDKRLEQLRLANEAIPFDAYRARQILKEAHARCCEHTGTRISKFSNIRAARIDLMPRSDQSRRDPVERYESLPGFPYPPPRAQDLTGCVAPVPKTDLRFRESQCGLHAYEGTTMAYDWTGETTRKRTRVKLVAAIVLSLAIVLGVPAALSPFI
ncbi:hypothetical protein GR138_25470 [Shinella kummerowiae]|jgi:hypothetical protein|uniref:Uncharacterized protein n=2 Tax=Shinella kummerowiae TaxID=417745 RepID=A0A6N8SJA7_9HYPH|nr:hypothetical protein [Shinella kummerowiae]